MSGDAALIGRVLEITTDLAMVAKDCQYGRVDREELMQAVAHYGRELADTAPPGGLSEAVNAFESILEVLIDQRGVDQAREFARKGLAALVAVRPAQQEP